MKPKPLDSRLSRPAQPNPGARLRDEETWLVLMMILVCGLGTLALSGGGLWSLPILVTVLMLARVWLWGQVRDEGRPSDVGEGRP